MARPSRKDHLLDIALSLFVAEGYHSVGIDRVLAEANVAKMTLYKHFSSKEDLIRAGLEKRDADYRAWLSNHIEARPPANTPGGPTLLTAYVNAVEQWCDRPLFNGCAFTNAAAEFPDHDHPIHKVAAQHKRNMLAFVENLALRAGATNPAETALHLRLMTDGAVTMKQTMGSTQGFEAARQVVTRSTTN